MKKMLVVLMCFVFCLSSFPAQVLGEGTCTITVANTEFGEIFIDGMNENGRTVSVPQGHIAEIGVAPNHGYEIGSVTIGDTTYSTDAQIPDRSDFSQSVTINDDINVSVEFRLIKHTVTTVAGPNGSVSPENPEVDHGSDVTFTITPSAGYMINELRVDGHAEHVNESSQITVHNVQNDITLEVTFTEIVTYTITTIAGSNGSVSPENPVVEHGSDVTFTITPDPGYIIDELRVDGRPEMANEHNEFTVFNVQSDMTLEVTFLQVVAHTITIPKHPYINVQIVGGGMVPEGGSVITRNTGEIVSYYIMPERLFRLTDIIIDVEDGEDQNVSYDYYYDETAKKIRIDIETTSSHTLHIKTDYMVYYRHIRNGYAITSSEATSDTSIKNAIRRELALSGLDVQLNDMTILSRSPHISTNGVGYERIDIEYHRLHSQSANYVSFYVVDNYTDIIIFNCLGQARVGEIIIVQGNESFAQNLIYEIPINTQDYYHIFGPYGVEGINLSWANDKTFPIEPVPSLPLERVTGPFYKWQLHVVNRGVHVGKELNWFPLTLIKQDALCMNVQATSELGTQDTFAWDLDTYPHVNLDGATQQVFFGNDRVILEKPRDTIGDIASMRAAASNSPGYTFTNNPDGTITIDFLSDYYDKVTVPLTIVKQSGGTVQRNLIIHRVGVDIQAHNKVDGNPSPTRTVFHGTQYGNLVDFADGNRYKITASYYIPDYGDDRPYGLYVTRKYADGRIETQIITQPLSSPHPGQAHEFDFAKKIYRYNNGSSGWANVADYLIYAGPNAASAPVEVSVLVLKNAPTAGSTFGGVDYGSGTGVTWTKP